ncbi:glycosyltransferase family 2 protein [Rhodobaculum claviforme]|uniref:Glycosyl transferase n=1 Tax=Rhodobaculum claviforme TaxID=1549854 RepID=A0A934TKM0_9RHOB|nr:glycosyltransferase [Rhodobaculum claviforme]MBK5926778.1 glycosyl transferase [Rhodobaculum claviforme]
MSRLASVGAVVIGRNEGARLIACLASLPEGLARVVYVDSGSDDGSVAAATAAGVQVVVLDPTRPFGAARARNEGVEALVAGSRPDYVQFIDGDCIVAPGWVETAAAFLEAHPRAAVVCGRRRERFPDRSVYNRLADREWATPEGLVASCGGDSLMRVAPFSAVGGFNPALIAGEEPELCARLRGAGWEVHRIDAEMTVHDADMTRFSQWWRRARRGGLAAAQGAAMHGGAAERAQLRRALLWGLALPLVAVGGAVVTPWSLGLLLALPAQVIRLGMRAGPLRRSSWEWAMFATLGKTPEALGVLDFAMRRLRGRPGGLIEYK